VQPPKPKETHFAVDDDKELDYDKLLINPPIQYNFDLDEF